MLECIHAAKKEKMLKDIFHVEKKDVNRSMKNKAGYTAQDAPNTRLNITRNGRTYGPTDLRTYGRTDTTSYRDATAHLKTL